MVRAPKTHYGAAGRHRGHFRGARAPAVSPSVSRAHKVGTEKRVGLTIRKE